MVDTTRVYLITGFLGSGKTTLLNRIIDSFPKEKKLTLLVNEFGEVGVDGTLVEGDDIDMMEISKGSIFCVCVKTDFIKGLYELNTSVKPDVLLIESTGVANPTDLKRDLKLPIFNDRFHFQEQFCVIDAVHFLDAFEIYASLEKQIASSSVFIINKTDIATPESIEAVKKVIRQFHPEPLFYETTYADLPLNRFFDFTSEGTPVTQETEDAIEHAGVLSEQELEKFLDDLLDDPDLEITPPDALVSVAYQWEGHKLDQIENMARALPADIVRAKGFVVADGSLYIFNYVMGTWSIKPSKRPMDRITHKNILVFIGPQESMTEIESVINGENWKSRGVFQPYSGP
ncbi:MAG: GTP-binding protein [Deltaproteobacteria bacterium]|jgi:G3E family GTPase|nr:GTP-binding protein [Deltaproteobacteria bacterium]